VLDPRVLEEVLLVRRDHGLLSALAGERPDRLDVLPDGDEQILGGGRVARLPGWIVGLKTRMITAVEQC
jgi:hypothetical protein